MEEQDYRTTYELEDRNWWFVGMRRISLALLASRVPSHYGGAERRVLDVGCGTGIMLEHLQPFGLPTGLDFSSTALDFCRMRGAERLVRARGEQLPFADGSFDAVTAFGVLEHIEDDSGAVSEWSRVLKPGGRLVLLTSAYQWLWSGHDVSNHHARRYLTKDVGALLRDNGMATDTLSYLNTFLFPPILAVRALERLRRGNRPPAPKKDTGEVPAPINRLLTKLLETEGRILGRSKLPFGVSIIALATKTETPAGQAQRLSGGVARG